MSEIPDLFHDIFNYLNSVNVIAGTLKYREVSLTSRSDINDALKDIERNICKAAESMEELKDILRRKGDYGK
ncbi:MAG: hypothetical protein ABIH71_03935 [Candidatus Omnitrophota bacterium]|nr:hypothetical protein [Candidatus Omnitrophota bacterium]